MFRRFRPDPRQLYVPCALLEARYVIEVTLAFVCVLDSPAARGSHDCLSLWVKPAPICQEWPNINVNMLVHVEPAIEHYLTNSLS